MNYFKKFNQNKSVVYTFIITMFPLLMMYSTTIGSLNIGDFLLLIFFLISLFDIKKIEFSQVSLIFGLYVSYVALHLLIMFISGININITLRYLRYLFYCIVIIYCNQFFDFEKALKFIIILCIVSTLYIIIQQFLKINFHKELSGYIPFLPLTEPLRDSYLPNRSRSIFYEPAMYSTIVLLGVILDLEYITKNKWKLFLLFSLGIVISSSNTGILVLGCIIFYYGIKLFFKYSNYKYKYLYLFITLCILFLIYKCGLFDIFIYRMTKSTSVSGRFYSYMYIFEKLDIKGIIFGKGMYAQKIFLAGYPRIIFYFGMLGLLIFMIINLIIYNRIDRSKKLILILFLILNVGTEYALGYFIMLFYSFIFCETKKVNVQVP